MKSPFTFAGGAVGGVGLSSHELFIDEDIVHFFQRLDVARQIAVGQVQQLLEGVEVNRIVDHQHRHDAQPHTAFKSLVKVCEYLLHFSYLTYMYVP